VLDRDFLNNCCDHCEYNALVERDYGGNPIMAICDIKRGDELVFERKDAPQDCPYKEG